MNLPFELEAVATSISICNTLRFILERKQRWIQVLCGLFPRGDVNLACLPREVVFQSLSASRPLPNPRYLEFHATAVKVIRLLGVGDYARKDFLDDMEV